MELSGIISPSVSVSSFHMPGAFDSEAASGDRLHAVRESGLPFDEQLCEALASNAGKRDQHAALTARHLQEVEGLFISMMLKNLRSSESGEGLFAGDRSDTFGGMFDMYLGEHLAESGGVGLSQLLRETRLPQTASTVNPGEPTNRYSLAVRAYQAPEE